MVLPKFLQGLALTGGFEGELTEEFFDEISLLDNLVLFALSDYDYSMSMNGQDPYVQGSRIPNNFCSPAEFDSGCKVPDAFEKIAGRLIMISVAFNNFNDIGLPRPLRVAKTATSIYLENNKFSGPFKLSDMEWESLQVLNIASNDFSGDIYSDAFGTNSYWVKIDISDNNLLVGHFDDVLCDQLIEPNNDSGTLEYLDISGTGIGCFAKCYKEASMTDYALTLIFDEDNAEVCASDPQLNALQELCGAMHCHLNSRYDSWNFDSDDNGDIKSDPCVDSWYGVTCSPASTPENMMITELNLEESEISGALDDSISQLEYLLKLNVSHNNIRGYLPATIWTMKNLEQFDANSNVIQGDIDYFSFEAGGSLKLLDIGNNYIRGRIPILLRNLENLQYLDISANTIYDIPTKDNSMLVFEGHFPDLKELRLQDNELSGELHSCSLLDTLRYLNIADNYFECTAECWSSALSGTKVGLTMIHDRSLIVCGNTHYPTMKPSMPPTAVPTPVPVPTTKPTTAAPTTSDLNLVDVTSSLEIEGVSILQWNENKELFDEVFKEALIMTVANRYITTDHIQYLDVFPLEKIPDRRLELRLTAMTAKENSSLRRNLQESSVSAVEVVSRIFAAEVIGDTSQTVADRINAKTQSGELP